MLMDLDGEKMTSPGFSNVLHVQQPRLLDTYHQSLYHML